MYSTKAKFFDSQVDAEWACSRYTEDEMRRIERMLHRAGCSRGMRILEPGCGTGRLSEILAKRVGPSGTVLAFDISPAMVSICRRRVKDLTNVDVREAALEELDLLPGEFDIAVCHQVFPHFNDKAKAVEILAGAVRKHGIVVVFHLMNSHRINDMHRKTDPAVKEDFLPDETSMRELFATCGFNIEHLIDDDEGYLLTARRS